MKVVLINPMSSFYSLSRAVPLGICYLASVSEKIAEQTEIIDAMQKNIKTSTDIVQYILSRYPYNEEIVFGFSLHQWNVTSYREIISELKRYYLNAYFVVGGMFVSLHSDIVNESLFSSVDVAIVGAGEVPFELVLKKYINKDYDLVGIPNIYWKKNDIFIKNSMDKNVYLNHSDVFPQRKMNIKKTYGTNELSILTSRGCPGRCAYCAISGLYKGKWIPRPVNDIIEEAKMAIIEQNYEIGFFVDDCFLVNKRRALEIAKQWKEKIRIPFYFAARVCDIVKFSEDEIMFLRECGCFRIEIGFENFSDEVLKRYKKGVTSKENIKAIMLVRKAKIDIKADIIMWDYYSTLNEIRENLVILNKYRLFCTHHLLQKLVPISNTETEAMYRIQNLLFYNGLNWDYDFRDPIIQKIYNDITIFKKIFYGRIMNLENSIRKFRSSTINPYAIVKLNLKIEKLHQITYDFASSILAEPEQYNLKSLLSIAEKKVSYFETEISDIVSEV